MAESTLGVVRGRLQGYLLFWIIQFGIYFNLFVAWGQTDPAGGCSLGDYVGLGQWRIEKQRYRKLYQQPSAESDPAPTEEGPAQKLPPATEAKSHPESLVQAPTEEGPAQKLPPATEAKSH